MASPSEDPASPTPYCILVVESPRLPCTTRHLSDTSWGGAGGGGGPAVQLSSDALYPKMVLDLSLTD